MAGWQIMIMNSKGHGRKHSWPNEATIMAPAWRDWGKPAKDLNHNIWCSSWDSNRAPPKYKSGRAILVDHPVWLTFTFESSEPSMLVNTYEHSTKVWLRCSRYESCPQRGCFYSHTSKEVTTWLTYKVYREAESQPVPACMLENWMSCRWARSTPWGPLWSVSATPVVVLEPNRAQITRPNMN